MENHAQNEDGERAGAVPGPRVMLIATVVAFGGALAVYGVEPWGPLAAMALMAAWAVFLFGTALRQNRRDRLAGRIPGVSPRTSSPFSRVVQGLFLIGALASFGYAMWLERHGASRDVSRPWSDGGFLLMLLGWILGGAIDAVMSRVSRRRAALAERV